MKKKLLASGVAISALVAGIGWHGWPRAEPGLRLPGIVESQEVRLGSRAGGRVVAVDTQEGQTVTPGQVLVRFEAGELTARRDQAKSRLEAAQATWGKVHKGPLPEEVAEARAAEAAARARLERLKAGNRDEQVRRARHELDAEVAALTRAEKEYERAVSATRSGVGSGIELDAATAARDGAKARVNAARAALDLVTQGSRAEDICEAEADRDRFAARHALLAGGSREEDKATAYAAVAEAHARLAEVETALREAVVLAPELGRVEVVAVRAGDLVPAGQPVVRLLRADDRWVKVERSVRGRAR